jgi:muramoyltetrapeptide carboxypeptidase LdcA involved in peptidoglycan recycling
MIRPMSLRSTDPRYSAPLRRRGRIAVTAPSSGVEPPLHPRLDLCMQHLRAQGFSVEQGQCLRAELRSASASAARRASELRVLLERDDIHAVIPPWGGELAIEILERIDWAALRQLRPKWVLGYSDTSTWMLPLTLIGGWATAHGPCLMDLAPGQDDALTRATMSHLQREPGSTFIQHASTHWQRKWTDFAAEPQATYALTETTRWQRLNGDAEAPVALRGRLIGGCIDTLVHLAGTRYGDIPAFIATHRADGVLLYLENAELSPTAWVRAIHHLSWHGWFDGIAGLLIGRSAAADTSGAQQLRYLEALQASLGQRPFPVLFDLDIGHRPPQMTLINGALADVQFDGRGGGSITQHLT